MAAQIEAKVDLFLIEVETTGSNSRTSANLTNLFTAPASAGVIWNFISKNTLKHNKNVTLISYYYLEKRF